MSGFEMFCERCGKRYGSGEVAATSSLPLTKRFLLAVGVSTTVPKPPADEPFLRFCLACRGYSCPACWNDEAGFCQTCVPLPEPVVEHVHLPEFVAPPSMAFAPTELTASALAFGQTDLPQVGDMPPGVEAEAVQPWAADTAIPWAPKSQVPWATEMPAVPWSTDPTLAAPDVDQAAGDVFPQPLKLRCPSRPSSRMLNSRPPRWKPPSLWLTSLSRRGRARRAESKSPPLPKLRSPPLPRLPSPPKSRPFRRCRSASPCRPRRSSPSLLRTTKWKRSKASLLPKWPPRPKRSRPRPSRPRQ